MVKKWETSVSPRCLSSAARTGNHIYARIRSIGTIITVAMPLSARLGQHTQPPHTTKKKKERKKKLLVPAHVGSYAALRTRGGWGVNVAFFFI